MATGEAIGRMLAPLRIMKVISQIRPAALPISNLLGFNIGGPNRLKVGGRNFGYDVMNHTRRIPSIRTPEQPAAVIEPQKVGSVTGTFPRAAEEIVLLFERMMNQRQIGGQSANLDIMGERYITAQEKHLAEKFGNLIEFMAVAMLRGSIQYTTTASGDLRFMDYGTSAPTIDFRIPSGNKAQLNMLGGGNLITASWALAATPIPSNIMQISKAMLQLCGFPLKHIVCGSDVWTNIINNTAVIQGGGPQASPFEKLQQDDDGNFTARVKAIPWIEFHIVDTGLETGASYTYNTALPADCFFGFPEISSEWCEFLEGSEVVIEGQGNAPMAEQYGFYPFAYKMFNPAKWNLQAVFNGLPALYVPNAVVFGDTTP